MLAVWIKSTIFVVLKSKYVDWGTGSIQNIHKEIKTYSRLYCSPVTQWAAVNTYRLLIKTPPQPNWGRLHTSNWKQSINTFLKWYNATNLYLLNVFVVDQQRHPGKFVQLQQVAAQYSILVLNAAFSPAGQKVGWGSLAGLGHIGTRFFHLHIVLGDSRRMGMALNKSVVFCLILNTISLNPYSRVTSFDRAANLIGEPCAGGSAANGLQETTFTFVRRRRLFQIHEQLFESAAFLRCNASARRSMIWDVTNTFRT